MDENLPGPTAESDTGVDELRTGYKRLRVLFHCLSISLLILTGVLFIFIYRQVVVIRKQTEQIGHELAEFEKTGALGAIQELRARLFPFAQQHPDFRPIYIRYFGTNAPPALPVIAPARTNLGTNSPR